MKNNVYNVSTKKEAKRGAYRNDRDVCDNLHCAALPEEPKLKANVKVHRRSLEQDARQSEPT